MEGGKQLASASANVASDVEILKKNKNHDLALRHNGFHYMLYISKVPE